MQVKMVHRVQQEIRVHKVHKVHKVIKVMMEKMVLPGKPFPLSN
jgi:hypothetical protein